jgi:hypothetical protein
MPQCSIASGRTQAEWNIGGSDVFNDEIGVDIAYTGAKSGSCCNSIGLHGQGGVMRVYITVASFFRECHYGK